MHKNKINNKAYIGQTKQGIKTRWKKHVFDSGNLKSKDYNSYFHKAIRKYSISNWESKIIEQNIDNIDDANSKEIFWIAMFKTNESDFGYNSNSGGKHCLLTSNVIEKIKKSNSGKKRSEETKKKNKSSIIW